MADDGGSGTGREHDISSSGLQLLDSISASDNRSDGPLLDCPRS